MRFLAFTRAGITNWFTLEKQSALLGLTGTRRALEAALGWLSEGASSARTWRRLAEKLFWFGASSWRLNYPSYHVAEKALRAHGFELGRLYAWEELKRLPSWMLEENLFKPFIPEDPLKLRDAVAMVLHPDWTRALKSRAVWRGGEMLVVPPKVRVLFQQYAWLSGEEVVLLESRSGRRLVLASAAKGEALFVDLERFGREGFEGVEELVVYVFDGRLDVLRSLIGMVVERGIEEVLTAGERSGLDRLRELLGRL